MKHIFIIVLSVSFCCVSVAQQKLPDSLRTVFQEASNDSVKFKLSRAIYTFYEETNRDSALYYAELRYAIAKKYNRKIEMAYLQGQMGYQQIFLSRFSEALSNLTEALDIATTAKNAETWELTPFSTAGKSRELTLSMINHMIGHLKLQTGSNESLYYFKEGSRIGKEIGNDFRVTVGDMVLATNYLFLKKTDSALFYAKEGEQYGIRGGITKYLAYIWSVMGDIYLQKGLGSLALFYYKKSLYTAMPQENFSVVAGVYSNLINYYLAKENGDSVLYYAGKNLNVIKSLGAVTSIASGKANLGLAYQDLASAYTLKNNTDSANKYLRLALKVKDSLTAIKLNSLSAFQRLTLDQQVRLQTEEKNRIEVESKRNLYILFTGIGFAACIILLIYRNNRQKTKANVVLQQQKLKVEITLQELKATQAQLIQSEKMASLGELTAGIAHEIQNPLNFVNNFSEINNELIDELKSQKEKLKPEEQDELLTDIFQNNEKINHHGKRADAIVKGMLQHSQSSAGVKEPTDINKLADEYLRLAYHGLRSKDKNFNATLKTDFDNSIGNVKIVPQDIGRVIFNLITNAFYTVNEKQKSVSGLEMTSFKKMSSLNMYEPIVSISTKKIGNKILIEVNDNGNGIPSSIVDKIFQPFFTTKPTGQGTGLGLSLSYDIITKGHGGELKVETTETEGTTFIIQLPIV